MEVSGSSTDNADLFAKTAQQARVGEVRVLLVDTKAVTKFHYPQLGSGVMDLHCFGQDAHYPLYCLQVDRPVTVL